MIVTCGECGLKYKIDPEKIKGEKARLKCKGCSVIITFKKSALYDVPEDTDTEQQEDQNTTHEDSHLEEDSSYEVEEQVQGALAAEIQKRTGLRLTTKAMILMVLVSVAPLLLYFVISLGSVSQQLERETVDSGKRAAESLANEVNVWLTQNISALKMLAQQHDIQAMNRYQQEVLLKTLQKEYPWITLSFTTDVEGLNIARSDGKGLKDYSNRAYIKDITVKERDVAWKSLIGRNTKNPSLVLTVPIENDSRIVGVLGASISREAISKIITGYQRGETGSAFLVDDFGQILAHRDSSFVMDLKDFSNHPLVRAGKNQVKEMIEFSSDVGEEFIGFAHGVKLGWTVVVLQKKDEAYSAANDIKTYAVLIVLLTIIGVALVAYYATRSVATSLVDMADAANRVANGETDVEIISINTDEVGDLADAITRMQDSLILSIQRLQMGRK